MKTKLSIIASSLLFVCASSSNAAVFAIGNVGDFLTDTLYANMNNTLMSSGVVTIGYFGSTVVDADINSIPGLFSQLGGFTTASSSTPGTLMGTFGVAAPGYADNSDTAASSGLVTLGSNASLLGRSVYSIVTSAASLGAATSTDQFALVKIGVIANDEAGELTYSSNPAGLTPLIGSIGSFTGSLGIDFDGPGGEAPLPSSTYSTLVMKAVPEPSAFLLTALGALCLLRRKR